MYNTISCKLLLLVMVATTLNSQFLKAATPAATPSSDDIELILQRTMDQFKVPGMALSVVYQGEVLYAGGRGIRETGKKPEVDGQTLFQIASVSKAFTAATLALLVDDGKLDWDDPVIDYLPEFRMFDPWVTREFTIRDLLTHRSGLPLGAGDLLLFPEAESTREEIIHALRYLQPSSSFRSKYDYDNLLFIVAGEVVARVAGMTFEDYLEQALLQPLGMNDCRATLNRVDTKAARATPHLLIDDELQITSSKITDTSAAAGGINCNAISMAKWMDFVLAEGLLDDGTQLISTAQFQQILNPVTLTPTGGYLAEHSAATISAYALGWGVSTFYGEPMYSHGGGLWGMTSFLMILPRQNLAVFASNNLMSAAPRAVVNEIVDHFLVEQGSADDRDWIAIVAEASNTRAAIGVEAVAAANAARKTDSTPAFPLQAYVGTYRDAWYGEIYIELTDDGRLWFRSGRSTSLSGPLEHFQNDTFIARWVDRQLLADSYVSFSFKPEGSIEGIKMKAVSPTTDFSFDFHDLDLKFVMPE